MNLAITADWPMTPEELVRVPDELFAAYVAIQPVARRVFGLNDPWNDYAGTLSLIVHKTGFDGHDGWTHWFPHDGDSKIEFAWDAQNREGENPLRHEWCHWFALQAGHPHWAEAGHGTDKDPFMAAAIEDLRTLYGSSFWTEEALVAFLGYTEIDFRRPEFHNLNLQYNFRTWGDGVLWCDVAKDGKRVDFTKNEGSAWLWHFKAQGGRLVTRVFDKVAE